MTALTRKVLQRGWQWRFGCSWYDKIPFVSCNMHIDHAVVKTCNSKCHKTLCTLNICTMSYSLDSIKTLDVLCCMDRETWSCAQTELHLGQNQEMQIHHKWKVRLRLYCKHWWPVQYFWGGTLLEGCPVIFQSTTQCLFNLSVMEAETATGVMIAQNMLSVYRMLSAMGLQVQLPMVFQVTTMTQIFLQKMQLHPYS